jgi:hypothetical protein
VWVMLAAPELQEREELLRAALLRQGQVVERREFELADVHLVTGHSRIMSQRED